MENRGVAILTLLALTTPGVVSAYAVPTHRGITEVTVEAYERIHGDLFTDIEAARVVRGADEEDADPRYANHFYDPINGRGLSRWYRAPIGIFTYPSKQWAQDPIVQAQFMCVVRSRKDDRGCFLGYGHGYADKRFSSPVDFSWDRAIYEYVWGNKERGVESLGHVLHLIQDATVPAHVRNDDHTSGDTYEDYSARFTQENISVPASVKPSNFSNIGEAFERVASYTNITFVSDDTVFEKYPRPVLGELLVRNGYAQTSNRLKVAQVELAKDKFGVTSVVRQSVDKEVAMSLWPHLSQKAVEAGVGVIDLFFRATEEEKRTGRLKAMNVSQKEQDQKETILKTFNVAKLLYGSSLTQEDVNELLEDKNQVGAAALAINSVPVPTPPPPPPPQPVAPAKLSPVQIEVLNETTEADTEPAETATSTTEEKIESGAPQQFSQALVPVTPGFGGGGGGSPAQEESTAAPESVALIISSPLGGSFFATTTVIFAGSTDINGLVSLASGTSTATTTADASGNWSAQLLLEEGNSTVTIQATDNLGERATSTSFSVFTDITPPSLPAVSLPQCANSLAIGFCLLPTASVSIVWADVSDAAYYAVAVNGALGATTTATSSIENVNFVATSSVAVIAYDLAGNASTSTTESLYVIERPIIINEVAWAGTDATATDEWIELKNVSVFQIDLSHITLNIDDSSVALNGVLDANDVYLIEDRAEATSATQDMVADIELPDTGAKLSLMSNDITMDSTPETATCPGWCAGSAASVVGTSAQHGDLIAKRSMERTGSEVDGTLASSWQNNDTYIRISVSKAADSAAGVMYGTPASQNSSDLPSAGWDCGDGTLSSVGGAYNPTSSACTYLSAFVNTAANRYGDVYKGTVGSSTLVAGHLLSKLIQSSQNDEGITNGAVAGDQFFVAIFETRTGPAFNTDLTDFRNYFKTGVGTPPHSNYVTIPWTYAP